MPDRLQLAIEKGHVTLPEGNILVCNASKDTSLSGFEREQTQVLSQSFSVNAGLRASGWQKRTALPAYAAAVVILPRARDAQRAALRFARTQTDGPIIVDGNKSDGVEALYRELKPRALVSDAWSKAHGKVFTLSDGDFEDWPLPEPFKAGDGWWRAPGVFSADGIDPGSRALADALPMALPGVVVDLGAGWGYLSRAILEREGIETLHLVEDEVLALDCARRNIDHPSAVYHGNDALTWAPPEKADHVVTNPPFHVGRKADPKLGQAFIVAAARMLKPKGQLWLVANRHLPYENTLEDVFRTVNLHSETSSFKIFHATSPKRRKA